MSKRSRSEYRPSRVKLGQLVDQLDRDSGNTEEINRNVQPRRQPKQHPITSIMQLSRSGGPELVEKSRAQVMDIIHGLAHTAVDIEDWINYRNSMTDEDLATEAEELAIELYGEQGDV